MNLQVLFACLLVVLGACSTRSAGLQRSDSLVIASLWEPTSLNPLFLQGREAEDVSALGYSFLTKYDANDEIVADAATVVPSIANGGISPNGKRIVYHLRHNVKWQDGYPVTARDVVFTYRASVNPFNSVPSESGYNPIARVLARDPYTIVVDLKRAYAPIISTFLGGDGSPILPAHLLAAYTSLDHATFNGAPVGSGPYRFTKWRRGDRLDAVANENYYGTRPRVRHISVRFVQDYSTIVNELTTGEAAATFFMSPSKIAAVQAIPGRRVIVTRKIPSFGAIVFNMNDPIAGELALRRSFAMAIDRKALVTKAASGLYDADTGMRGMFTWAFDPTMGTIAYDPECARTLLTAKGWMEGNDGIRSKNGRRLEMRLAFWGQSFVATQVVPMIVEEARAVGIDLSPRAYGQNELYSRDGPLYRGGFQAALLGMQNGVDPDPSAFLMCAQRPPNGFNFARYCDADVDNELRRALAVYDRAERRRIYGKIQQKLLQRIPYDFLWQASEIDVVPVGLRGYAPSPSGGPFNSVAQWRI